MSILVPAAVAAVVGTLWAPSWTLGTIAIMTILLAGALAATALPGSSGDGARRCIAVCAALAIGVAGTLAGERLAAARLPVPDHEVITLAGHLIAGAGGSSPFARVRLQTAGSARVVGSASGEALLYLDAPPPPVGSRVVAVGRGASPVRDHRGVLRLAASLERSRSESAPRRALLVTVRERARESINLVSGSAAGLLRALVLGESDDVDPRVEILFRRSGTIHLLALSGMHLAVIALLVTGCVRPLVGRRSAAWVAVVFGALYVVLAGPRPGLVRAALLVTFTAALRELDRPQRLPELLAATMLVQLVIQPGVAGSLGFQLSYLSLLGIALLTPCLSTLLGDWIPPRVASPLAAGVGAQVTTVPLLLARFGVWYPGGIVASIVMGPLVLGFMSAGIVSLGLATVGLPSAAMVLRPLLEVAARTIEGAAWLFSGLPGVRPADPTAWATAAALGAGALVVGMRLLDRIGAARRAAAGAGR